MIDTDYIHPPRGVERRAKLGAGHSESNNTDKDLYATEVVDIGED